MEIYPFSMTDSSVSADLDESAAVVAAICMYLEAEEHSLAPIQLVQSPWARAARLEAQGIPIRPDTLLGKWRV